jgi:tetratricopeptide (TPR) repeat protein
VLYGKLAVERFPENPLFYMFVGSGYFFEGQYDSARYYLETSLSYAQPSQLDLRFQVHAYLGDISFSLENYDQVDYHFEKALDIDSTSLYIKNNYSYYLSLREEKLEYARELSLATIEKEPGNPTYLDTYAWIVFKLKRVDEALIYIERAIENGAGNNAEVLEHYGDILKAHYRFQDAMRQYQKALLLDPGNETLQEKIKGLNQ